jgi:hypothetical protein
LIMLQLGGKLLEVVVIVITAVDIIDLTILWTDAILPTMKTLIEFY